MFEHFERDARQVMRACAVRGILLDRIYNHRSTITYKELANALNTLPGGGELSQSLTLITADDAAKKLPLSVAIVVNSMSGVPGEGFFNQCRELGLLPNPDPFSPSEVQALIERAGDRQKVSSGPLRADERDFWINQISALKVDASIFWDKEIQREMGDPSMNGLPRLPEDLWETKLPEGAPFKLKCNLMIGGQPAEHFKPFKPNIPKILLDSATVVIPAYFLRHGDVVDVVLPGGRKTKEVVDIIEKSARQMHRSASGGQSTSLPEEVRWHDTHGNIYVEPYFGPIHIDTPKDILERINYFRTVKAEAAKSSIGVDPEGERIAARLRAGIPDFEDLE